MSSLILFELTLFELSIICTMYVHITGSTASSYGNALIILLNVLFNMLRINNGINGISVLLLKLPTFKL